MFMSMITLLDLYQYLYQQPTGFLLGLLIIFIWSVVWKGFGLWFSAKNRQTAWFIAIIVFNTVGLLPIIYLIWFRPREIKKKETKLQEFVKREKAKLANPTETKADRRKNK